MAAPDTFQVTVVLAEPQRQVAVTLQVGRGTTVDTAVELSGLLEARDDLERSQLGLAIFGRVVEGTRELEPGDRVEVLRPLRKDPRARRRQLAREGRTMGRGSAGRR